MKAYRIIFSVKGQAEVIIDVCFTMGTLLDAVEEYCKGHDIDINNLVGLQVLDVTDKCEVTNV